MAIACRSLTSPHWPPIAQHPIDTALTCHPVFPNRRCFIATHYTWPPTQRTSAGGCPLAAADVTLARCTAGGACLRDAPQVAVGGSGVSGSAFVDNAAFRAYAFDAFGARVLDMESAAVSHVAYANGVPLIAIRSLSDLAGGREGENQMEVFLGLAAGNAATVVMALLRAIPEGG